MKAKPKVNKANILALDMTEINEEEPVASLDGSANIY